MSSPTLQLLTSDYSSPLISSLLWHFSLFASLNACDFPSSRLPLKKHHPTSQWGNGQFPGSFFLSVASIPTALSAPWQSFPSLFATSLCRLPTSAPPPASLHTHCNRQWLYLQLLQFLFAHWKHWKIAALSHGSFPCSHFCPSARLEAAGPGLGSCPLTTDPSPLKLLQPSLLHLSLCVTLDP